MGDDKNALPGVGGEEVLEQWQQDSIKEAFRPIVHLLERLSFDAVDLLKNNTVTVEEYARSLLGRIKERDSIVKASVYLDEGLTIKQAQALDQNPHGQPGPLHRIAVGVKDVINTKDMPTQFGSPLYQGHQSGFDSSAVAILRAAGALIFGKTTTTEFTVTNSGPDTANPHDPSQTPGGSSCGSAAAVADFQVPISLGAQTGGSLIRPASQKTFSPTFDTFGFIASSMQDLQLPADVFGLQDDEPPASKIALEKATVTLIKTPPWHRAGPGTVVAMEKAVTILEEQGIKIEEVSSPPASFALDGFASMRALADDLAAKYFVIITPSAEQELTYSALPQVLHMPVINVPAFVGSHGMPIGISLVAGRFHDQHLIGTGKVLGEFCMAGGSGADV
ncbi:amidase signature domain-containing protein [Podospora didyma]|uniref:Amidase signature domain-containing protein n=1 Tax=Podospora didyma TaxID=330526 RepID=A0AAE0NU97_9PEZI|nr:amidase signature domain-containing protein [Podospora didyma]